LRKQNQAHLPTFPFRQSDFCAHVLPCVYSKHTQLKITKTNLE